MKAAQDATSQVAVVLLTRVFVALFPALIFRTSGGAVSARWRHLQHGLAQCSYSTRGYYTAPQSVVGVATYVPSILTALRAFRRGVTACVIFNLSTLVSSFLISLLLQYLP
jgi:hypothetical protein